MKQLMELIEKYIDKEVELEFQVALTESETVAELKARIINFEIPNSIFEERIQEEIGDKYYKKIKEHIENMKVN